MRPDGVVGTWKELAMDLLSSLSNSLEFPKPLLSPPGKGTSYALHLFPLGHPEETELAYLFLLRAPWGLLERITGKKSTVNMR